VQHVRSVEGILDGLLQRLEQGRFQQLGDRVVPYLFAEFSGLKPNGLTAEGKTRKGVLDAVLAREHGTSGDAKSFGSHAGLMDNPCLGKRRAQRAG